ncbi:MAG TPA: pentapeptide repeat-containing protein [Fibrobacteria bacterium]|nr:pentapeptide repeat-containing protein [Fibrobacteria bacterium]
MSELRYSEIRKTLTRPLDFQEQYGNHAQNLHGFAIQQDEWRGVSIKGWSFKGVKFESTTWKSDTFENVTFEDCTFHRAILDKCVFRNCTFRKMGILGGEWKNSRFEGGAWENAAWMPSPVSNMGVKIQGLEFSDVKFSEFTPLERSGDWRECRFSRCSFANSDLSKVDFHKPIFSDAMFKDVVWEGFDGRVYEGRCERCSFENVLQKNGDFDGDVEDIKVEGGNGISVGGKVTRGMFRSSEGAFLMGEAKDVEIHGGKTSLAVGQATNLKVWEINKGSASFKGGGKNIEAIGIKVGLLDIMNGVFENCHFKDVNTKHLDLSGAIFKNCKFENFHVRERLYINPPPKFENCEFVNFHRDSIGVGYKFSDDPPESFWLPFERK